MSYTTFKRVELENERKRQIEEQKAANPQLDGTPNSQDDTIDTTTTRDPQEQQASYNPASSVPQIVVEDMVQSPVKDSEIQVVNWF